MTDSPYLQAMRESLSGGPQPFGPPGPFPPWRVWEALIVVALFAVAQPVASLATSVVMEPALQGLSGNALEDRLLPVMLPVVIAFSHAIGWASLYALARRHGLGLAEALRLRLRDLPGRGARRVLAIVAGGMGMQLISVLLAGLFPPPEGLENPLMRFVRDGGPGTLVLLVLMAVVMAPLVEEALFRGCLLPALRRRLSFVPAAVLVTILFALLHTMQTSGYWPALVAIFAAGYLMAVLRERTGALWPSVLFHMGFNLMAVLPLVLTGGHVPQQLGGLLY